MLSTNNKIAVIGAGITGVTTAYKLTKRGFHVSLYDAQPYAAMETSFANGGQLSASNAEVWNAWSTVLKGLKWMLRPGAPLLVSPRPSWRKLSWFVEFIAAIPQYERNTIATVRLALLARRHLLQMAEDEQIDFNCERRGILHFYQSKAAFDAAAEVTKLLKRGGLERRAVSPSEIREIEPALAGPFYGGFYTESDFTGDIHKFATSLADACARKGCDMRFGEAVADLQTRPEGVLVRGRPTGGGASTEELFDKIVICAGVASRDLARRVGDRVNIYPVKGYSITVGLDDAAARSAAPWTSLLDDDAKVVTSRLGADRFRVAGTAEFSGANKDIRWSRIEPLIGWCRRHLPEMSTRSVTPWAGLRPMTPTMTPKVGPGRDPRVFYNTGHGHLGWTLSAATAEMVSSMVETEDHALQPVTA